MRECGSFDCKQAYAGIRVDGILAKGGGGEQDSFVHALAQHVLGFKQLEFSGPALVRSVEFRITTLGRELTVGEFALLEELPGTVIHSLWAVRVDLLKGN